MSNECIFCKIINKEIDSRIIYENNLVVAFLDVDQNDLGHTLIVPKKHFKNLEDIEQQYLFEIIDSTKLLYKRFKERLNIDGLTAVQNNEEAAGQTVFHYHMHLIPKYLGLKPRDIDIDALKTILL